MHARSSASAEMDMDLTFAMDLGSPTVTDSGAPPTPDVGVEMYASASGSLPLQLSSAPLSCRASCHDVLNAAAASCCFVNLKSSMSQSEY